MNKKYMNKKFIKWKTFENFEIYVRVDCYKSYYTSAPGYYIDKNTGENVGQHVDLVIFPDGTYEPQHYQFATESAGVLYDLE